MISPPDLPPAAIVVTATPAPGDKTLQIRVIGRDELARSPTTQLDQIIKEVAGLTLFRRSDARSAHPTSQGVTMRALGGNASSRALLLLDGVPQADPFGGWVNWPAYDPASLASVRVTRGGGSAAFGPGALAGVIELSSRDLASDLSGELDRGSRDSIEASSLVGAALGRAILTLGGRYESGDGFVPVIAALRGPADRPAPYRAANVRARLVAPISGGTRAEIGAALFSDRRERGTAFTLNRSRGADLSLRLAGGGRWQWHALGYGQWRGLRSSFASVDAARSAASRASLQDDVPSHSLGASIELRPPIGVGAELRIGADGRFASGHSSELYSYVAGEPTRHRDSGGDADTVGLFEEMARTSGALTLTAGGRIDRWRIASGRLFEAMLADGAVLTDAEYPDRSGWRPTARTGAAVALGGGASIRAAAYLGWRLPTLNELFRPFRAGADATAANPMLDPERLNGAEIGAGLARRDFGLDATLYSNRLADPITNVTLGSGPGVFPGVGFVPANGIYRQRRNGAALRVEGIEVDVRARRGAWTLRAGYSLADARTGEGLRPAQTPAQTANASVSWQRARTVFSLSANYVGSQFEDDLNKQRLPRATSFDGFAQLPLKGRLALVLRGENLFNARIVAGRTSGGLVERATPRALAVGLRLID